MYKFVGIVSYEGKLIAITEDGSVYELDIHSHCWRLIISKPDIKE